MSRQIPSSQIICSPSCFFLQAVPNNSVRFAHVTTNTANFIEDWDWLCMNNLHTMFAHFSDEFSLGAGLTFPLIDHKLFAHLLPFTLLFLGNRFSDVAA